MYTISSSFFPPGSDYLIEGGMGLFVAVTSESDWEVLEISMPKTNENPFWTLIERLFDWLEQIFGRELLPGIFNL